MAGAAVAVALRAVPVVQGQENEPGQHAAPLRFLSPVQGVGHAGEVRRADGPPRHPEEGTVMCETKSTGIMPGFLIGRAQKAAQPCQCHQRAPRRTATQRAQTVLAGVGVVVAMAAANFLEHALLWVLLAVFCGLVVPRVALRSRRRASVLLPQPVPSAARTTVEAVHVPPIGARPAPRRAAAHTGWPPPP